MFIVTQEVVVAFCLRNIAVKSYVPDGQGKHIMKLHVLSVEHDISQVHLNKLESGTNERTSENLSAHSALSMRDLSLLPWCFTSRSSTSLARLSRQVRSRWLKNGNLLNIISRLPIGNQQQENCNAVMQEGLRETQSSIRRSL